MGGKSGGGGAEIPKFVKESQKMVGERSQQLSDLTQPIMAEGSKQLQSLLTTGGPGAQVPIISNIETGQQRAFNTANAQIAESMNRAGGGAPRDPSMNRIQEQLGIEQQASLKGIAPRVAAPLILSNMANTLGGPGMAQSGFASGAQALASGVRRPEQGQGQDLMGIGMSLASAYGGGGFGGGGKSAGSIGAGGQAMQGNTMGRSPMGWLGGVE